MNMEPLTPTGRRFLSEYIAEHSLDDLENFDSALRISELRRTIIGIEAEAAAQALSAPPDEGLLKALSRVSISHSRDPRCRELMPTDGRCSCGYDEVMRVLAANERQTDDR